MNFKIIQSGNPTEFEEMVNEKLQDGFIPAGPLQVNNVSCYGKLGEEYKEVVFFLGMIKGPE